MSQFLFTFRVYQTHVHTRPSFPPSPLPFRGPNIREYPGLRSHLRRQRGLRWVLHPVDVCRGSIGCRRTQREGLPVSGTNPTPQPSTLPPIRQLQGPRVLVLLNLNLLFIGLKDRRVTMLRPHTRCVRDSCRSCPNVGSTRIPIR